MKIVKLKGGLGNQMFQYAYAKLLEQLTGDTVKLDYSAYASRKGDAVRVPRVEKFNLTLSSASKDETEAQYRLPHGGAFMSLRYKIETFAEKTVNPKYFWEPNRSYIEPERLLKHSYFDGYWQSWRYVRQVEDIVRTDFVPNYSLSERTLETMRLFESKNQVFVGVRKGDYDDDAAHFGTFGSDYYRRAMTILSERTEEPEFVVFSNDIPWCKKNIDWSNFSVSFREPEQQTDDFEELMLMASCKHAIMINSTYHWWGAYLIRNPQKIVIGPENWFVDGSQIDIMPPEWVRIERNGG